MKGGKMTRKDFIKLADSLGIFQHHLSINDNDTIREEYQNLIDNIKHICKSANPKFDSSRFDEKIYSSFHNQD